MGGAVGARGEGAAARIDDPVSARGAETGETFGGDEGEICEGRHWACEQSTPTWNSEDKSCASWLWLCACRDR